MKLLNIGIFIILFSFISCNKDEEVKINPCANGVKDIGETEIDCGGPCKACYHYPYLVLKYKNSVKQASSKSIVVEGTDYLLNVGFDSILFQLNLGSNINVGIYDVSALNSGAGSNSKIYTFVSGVFGFSVNDTVLKQLSGNFVATFANQLDTLKILDGQFEYLPY